MVELEFKSEISGVVIHGLSNYWRWNVRGITKRRCYKGLTTWLFLYNHFVHFELGAVWNHLVTRGSLNVRILLHLSLVRILVYRTVGGLVVRAGNDMVLLLQMAHLSVAPS